MTVYVSKYEGRLGHEEKLIWQYCTVEGVKCKSFDPNLYASGKVNLDNPSLIVGSVETLTRYFENVGIEPPASNDYPASLKKYLHRNIHHTTLHNLQGAMFPIFIKPASLKLFTGRVFSSIDEIKMLANISDRTGLITSSLVDWVSEWRFYIHDGELISEDCYAGDPNRLPDRAVIKDAIRCIVNDKHLPNTCTVDFGILSSGETALIEWNDAWAIGAYSDISYRRYFLLLKSRWDDIHNSLFPK
mgnify:CR=1 FL=1|tara:strand:+ start:10628 stop:11362 length:735 start_codon:yes stop_codon:yes gene_type:complete